MREINHKRLRYFQEVHAQGSIRAAADALNTAPSVIARQVALLEEELGVTLFERRARGVTATEAAGYLLEYWRGCHAHHQQLAERLRAVGAMDEGSVRIVASEGFIDGLMEHVVAPFCAAHPRLAVFVDALAASDLVDAVAEDAAQIGLAYNPQEHPRIVFAASAAAPAKLLVRFGHPLTRVRGALPLQRALEYPLAVMPSGYGVSTLVETMAYAEHISLKPSLTSNSLVALKRFVRSTDGVMFIGAGVAAAAEIRARQFVMLDIAHPLCDTAQLRLLVRRDRPLSTAAAQLLADIPREFPAAWLKPARGRKAGG
jgi:DNA-binding transcriptional LysR family regulator